MTNFEHAVGTPSLVSCHFDRSGEWSEWVERHGLHCRLGKRRVSRETNESNLFLFRALARDYSFWVYIVTNRNHSVLYIGVTNSLSRRSWQHREGTGAIFPSAYRCTKLIYYEHYRDIRVAIARETQLKK
jgi:putative endonuclease